MECIKNKIIVYVFMGILFLMLSSKAYAAYDLNCVKEMNDAHMVAEYARSIGCSEDHEIILDAKQRYMNAQQEYSDIVNDTYSYASIIYHSLLDAGYNEYVSAGILGNIMAECGGHSLNINPYAKGKYYGICQWSSGYSDVWNTGLEFQIKYLINSIKYNMDTYGKNYQKGFSYDGFKQLTSETEAAIAFAKCYERCGSASYNNRKSNATMVYDYFNKKVD